MTKIADKYECENEGLNKSQSNMLMIAILIWKVVFGFIHLVNYYSC